MKYNPSIRTIQPLHSAPGNNVTTPRTPNPDPTKNQGGCPTLYDKGRFPHIAFQACAIYGATLPQLAKLLGVGERTVSEWMRTIPEFKLAIDQGRENWDVNRVEKTYLQRALGYEYEETTSREQVHYDNFGIPSYDTLETINKKQMAPDVRCLEGWLSVRNPERWRELRTNFVEGNVKHDHQHIVSAKKELDKLDISDLQQIEAVLLLDEN